MTTPNTPREQAALDTIKQALAAQPPSRVHNFQVLLQVDGRATSINTGPRAQNGGFELVVMIRENGGVSPKRINIRGYAPNDGRLYVTLRLEGIEGQSGEPIMLLDTDR